MSLLFFQFQLYLWSGGKGRRRGDGTDTSADELILFVMDVTTSDKKILSSLRTFFSPLR